MSSGARCCRDRRALRCQAVSEAVEVAIVGAGHAGLLVEPRAVAGRHRTRRSGARPGRRDVAGALGQLLSRHSQLDDAVARWPLRRRRSRRVHADGTTSWRISSATPEGSARRCARTWTCRSCGSTMATDSCFRRPRGDVVARHVVLASGAYQKPHRPAGTTMLPASIPALDVEGYTNPDTLPAGKVLVIGSGQTGCQLAEELLEAGRDVFLACGRAPWAPRRLDGRDIVSLGLRDAIPGERRCPISQARWRGWAPTCKQPAGTADTTCTTERSRPAASPWSAMSQASRMALPTSHPTSRSRWRSATRATPTSLRSSATRARPGARPHQRSRTRRHSTPIRPSEVDLRELGAVIFTCGFRPNYTELGRLPRRLRRPRVPDPGRWVEHGGSGPALHGRALPAQAQVGDFAGRRRGRRRPRRDDRRADPRLVGVTWEGSSSRRDERAGDRHPDGDQVRNRRL